MNFDLVRLNIDALATSKGNSHEAAFAPLEIYAKAHGIETSRRFYFDIVLSARGNTVTITMAYLPVTSGAEKAPGIDIVKLPDYEYAHAAIPADRLNQIADESLKGELQAFFQANGRKGDMSKVIGLIELEDGVAHVYFPTVRK